MLAEGINLQQAPDLILNLLDRLHRKVRIAAATVGVPTPLFPDSPTLCRDFATAVRTLGVEGGNATAY